MARRNSLKKRNTLRRKVSKRNRSMKKNKSLRRKKSLRRNKSLKKRVKSFRGGGWTYKYSGNQNDLGQFTDSYNADVYTPVLKIRAGDRYTEILGIRYGSNGVEYTQDTETWIPTEEKNIYIGANYTEDENRPYFSLEHSYQSSKYQKYSH